MKLDSVIQLNKNHILLKALSEQSVLHREHIWVHTVQTGVSWLTKNKNKKPVCPLSFIPSMQLQTNAIAAPELRLRAVAREEAQGSKSNGILKGKSKGVPSGRSYVQIRHYCGWLYCQLICYSSLNWSNVSISLLDLFIWKLWQWLLRKRQVLPEAWPWAEPLGSSE